MKKHRYTLSFMLLVMLLSIVGCNSTHKVARKVDNNTTPTDQSAKDEVNRTLIISYNDKDALETLEKAVKAYSATIVYEYDIINSIAIRIPQDKPIQEGISYFENVKGVLGVERDQVVNTQN